MKRLRRFRARARACLSASPDTRTVASSLRRCASRPRSKSARPAPDGATEAHHALGDIDAIADDVELAVDVAHQAYRPEIDADAYIQLERILGRFGESL